MRTRHPYPYNYRAIQTPKGWEVWLYDENTPESRVSGPVPDEQEARREAGQANLEYELNNIPTP